MEISGSPGGGGVHVSKGGCTCKPRGCTGSCSLNLQQIRHIGLSIFITGRYQLRINKKIAYKKSTNIKS